MIKQLENPILSVQDLTVSYDKKPVLWNINFGIPSGQIIGIMGPNGAGKSTLIKSIMGLHPLSSGVIKIFEKNLNQIRKKISYVPQRATIDWNFPITVEEVVMMGRHSHLGFFRKPRISDNEIVDKCIKDLGIDALRKRQISELSGGQQQRVFLARALAQEADLYFMDEPFVGVDASTEAVIIKLLEDIKNSGKTVVVVHHDLQTAASYFDWLVLLNQRLIASGPMGEVFTEKTLREAYGSQLTLLTKIANYLKQEGISNRVH